MQRKDCGFNAAIDADNSEGEGRYYLWSKEDLETAIDQDYELFLDYYGINLEKPHEGKFYHLQISEKDEHFLNKHRLSNQKLKFLKMRWVNQLRTIRKTKEFPKSDTKFITSWNTMAISGFIQA